MENAYYSRFSSPIGDIEVLSTRKGVRYVGLGLTALDRETRGDGLISGKEADKVNDPAISELQRYFAGRLREFSVPVDLRGTPFQLLVWRALMQIPYGEVRSYRQVAENIGIPRAARAVGGANAKNPVPIIVPCHRVIAAGGTIGGYSGGLDIKRQLLSIEGNLGPFGM